MLKTITPIMRVAASICGLTTTLLQACATVKRPPANYMRSPNDHNSQQRCSWDRKSVTAPLGINLTWCLSVKYIYIYIATLEAQRYPRYVVPVFLSPNFHFVLRQNRAVFNIHCCWKFDMHRTTPERRSKVTCIH